MAYGRLAVGKSGYDKNWQVLAMAIQLERKLFTVDEYEQMIKAGILTENDRLELIRGEIVKMAPIGVAHAACVTRLTTLLVHKVGKASIVWSQNPICLQDSEPEPDVVLLRPHPNFYASGLPTPTDILLLVEVADTTLASDRGMKVPLYAEAGIPEVWVVDLNASEVEVYTEPSGGRYRAVRRVAMGETLPLPGGLGGEVEVVEILG
jgi:Uma2 family endonuclease